MTTLTIDGQVVITGTAVNIHSGTAFPADPREGDCFYRTDLNAFFVYNGLDWIRWEIETHAPEHEADGADPVKAGYVRTGLDADKPVTPARGDMYFAYDTRYFYICNTDGNWKGVELA